MQSWDTTFKVKTVLCIISSCISPTSVGVLSHFKSKDIGNASEQQDSKEEVALVPDPVLVCPHEIVTGQR